MFFGPLLWDGGYFNEIFKEAAAAQHKAVVGHIAGIALIGKFCGKKVNFVLKVNE